MNRWIVAGLVVLNLVLGVGLFVHLGIERKAGAQIGGGRNADYAVVAGYSNNQTIIYLMETTSGNMVVLRADPLNHSVQLVGGRKVGDDIARPAH